MNQISLKNNNVVILLSFGVTMTLTDLSKEPGAQRGMIFWIQVHLALSERIVMLDLWPEILNSTIS